jgi:putative toxin-antitoxin system antitoxin component (TIGR02293 family)
MTAVAKSPGRPVAGKRPPAQLPHAAPRPKPAVHAQVAQKPTPARKSPRPGKTLVGMALQKQQPMSFTGLVQSQLPDLFAKVQGGLPPTMVDQGAEYLGLSKSEFADILQMSSSSLSRWSREKKVMPQAESDRVARVARVTLIVEAALGSHEDAIEWLNSKIPALGNVKPLSMLGSDSGVKIVEDLLVRAQAGVYG